MGVDRRTPGAYWLWLWLRICEPQTWRDWYSFRGMGGEWQRRTCPILVTVCTHNHTHTCMFTCMPYLYMHMQHIEINKSLERMDCLGGSWPSISFSDLGFSSDGFHLSVYVSVTVHYTVLFLCNRGRVQTCDPNTAYSFHDISWAEVWLNSSS